MMGTWATNNGWDGGSLSIWGEGSHITASDMQRHIDYVNRQYEHERMKQVYDYNIMQYRVYDNSIPCTQPIKSVKTEPKKPYKEESLRKLFWYRFIQTGELPFKKTFS